MCNQSMPGFLDAHDSDVPLEAAKRSINGRMGPFSSAVSHSNNTGPIWSFQHLYDPIRHTSCPLLIAGLAFMHKSSAIVIGHVCTWAASHCVMSCCDYDSDTYFLSFPVPHPAPHLLSWAIVYPIGSPISYLRLLFTPRLCHSSSFRHILLPYSMELCRMTHT
jgi:hypothetical protein